MTDLFVIGYIAMGVYFSIGCLTFVPGVDPKYIGCEAGTSFTYNITMVIRSSSMGVAGIDQPAVAELPWVAGDQLVPYSLLVRTPVTLPTGGWSLVVTANRVDWNDDDLVVGIGGKVENLIGVTVLPYTEARAKQCIPDVTVLPVPIRRYVNSIRLSPFLITYHAHCPTYMHIRVFSLPV
jgi:hypothetical protein